MAKNTKNTKNTTSHAPALPDAGDGSAPKRCSGCGVTKTEADFNWKSRAWGLRQSQCRDCASAVSRRHYEANRDTVKARSAARNAVVRAEHRATAAAARAAATCADCGAAGSERSLRFTSPADGSGRVTDAVAAAVSPATLRARIDAAVPLCQGCMSARIVAPARASRDALAAGPSKEMLLGDAVVAAVVAAGAELSSAEVIAALEASGRTDPRQSVRSMLSRCAQRGLVCRVGRGMYTAPGIEDGLR